MHSHYEQRLEKDLAKIRRRVAAVGVALDDAIADATQSFLERNRPLSSEVILGDFAINRATREIDQLCHRFVARHLPTAGMLRFVSAVLRISTALERIGDYAVSIAQESSQLGGAVPALVSGDIALMAEQGRSMLKQALTAFEDLNAGFARATMAIEYQADGVYRKVHHEILAAGEGGEITVRDLFAMHVTVNRLERITDQAKNVCEETVFAATGEIKEDRTCGVLFIDDRNSGASIMAHAISRKGYPECGAFASAGWEPASALDPEFVAFMDRHGHDILGLEPERLRTGFESLQKYQVIVGLAPDAEAQIETMPYSTVFLDWSEDVAKAGPIGEYTDEHREALYRVLTPKIEELIDLLRGQRPAE